MTGPTQNLILCAVVTPRGTIFTPSIRDTMSGAIGAAVAWIGKGCTWERLKQSGWEVRTIDVTATIRPETAKGEAA